MQGGLPEGVRRRLDPEQRYGLRVTLFGLALVLVAIPFSILLLQVVTEGPLTEVDVDGAEWLHERVRHRDGLIDAMRVLSFLGRPIWFVPLIGGSAAWLLWRGRIRLAAFLLVTTIGGGIVDTIVKAAVRRERPVLEDPLIEAFGKSFPSGHAMSSIIAYGALLLVFLPAVDRRWRTPVFLLTGALVLGIGVSRLFLGVHYLTDVIGGWVLGLAWLAGSTAAFSIWRGERGRRPVDVLEGLEPEAAADLGGAERLPEDR